MNIDLSKPGDNTTTEPQPDNALEHNDADNIIPSEHELNIGNKSIFNRPLPIRGYYLYILSTVFCLCVVPPLIIVLGVTPIVTVAMKTNTCFYCEKTVHRNNHDYTLKKSFMYHGKLRCDYMKVNSATPLYDYADGIKAKPECVYGLSIGMSIAFLLFVCSIYVSMICFCTLFSHSCINGHGMKTDLVGFLTLSDFLFGVCSPFILLKRCITYSVDFIKLEVDSYKNKLNEQAV